MRFTFAITAAALLSSAIAAPYGSYYPTVKIVAREPGVAATNAEPMDLDKRGGAATNAEPMDLDKRGGATTNAEPMDLDRRVARVCML
jgi:hypothetical protein